MPVLARELDRKVQFRKRNTRPTAPNELRTGFQDYGSTVWAAYRDGRPTELPMGIYRIQGKTGTLRIRDNAWARAITRNDRVEIPADGEEFEITSVFVPVQSDGAIELSVTSALSGATYSREFEQRGEVVTLRRTGSPNIERGGIRAIPIGYSPEELVAGISQGERRLLLSNDDIVASGFPLPLKENSSDSIIMRGRKLTIAAIDDSTHRIAGDLAAYQVQVKG